MKEEMLKVKDHIAAMADYFQTSEFRVVDIIEYVKTLNLSNVLEIVPADRKSFVNGTLATIIYK
ncbi:MAG: hypothetical protein ACRCYE_14195 [Sarcina sp.]